MSTENTPTPTAESENTGMTLYCGTGKELPESAKLQMPKSSIPAFSQLVKMALQLMVLTRKNTMKTAISSTLQTVRSSGHHRQGTGFHPIS